MTEKLKILSFTGRGIACSFALREIHKTIEKIGHEIQVVEVDAIEDMLQRNILNMENVLAFEPDMIITIDIIGLMLGQFFYNPPIKIVSLFFDNPNTHFASTELLLTMNNYFIFSIDKTFAEQPHGAHLRYTPWYFDPDYFQDLNLERIYDVSFIGHHNEFRDRLFRQLADTIHIHIWGDEKWAEVAHPNIHFHGFAHPREDTPRIYNQSKIVISLNAEQFSNGISERLYNIMACGAMAITNHMPVIQEHFETDKELVVFNDGRELATRISSLLNNPKRMYAIAARGKQKVDPAFTCETFLKRIIDEVRRTTVRWEDHQAALKNFADNVAFVCWDSHDFVGRLAYRNGMYDKACYHFTKAVEIDATQKYSYIGQISSLLKIGEQDEALRQYRKLRQIDDEAGALAENLFLENTTLHFEV